MVHSMETSHLTLTYSIFRFIYTSDKTVLNDKIYVEYFVIYMQCVHSKCQLNPFETSDLMSIPKELD